MKRGFFDGELLNSENTKQHFTRPVQIKEQAGKPGIAI